MNAPQITMSKRKRAQIEEALRRQISQTVLYELADPRLGFVTVTEVEVARDLKSAKVSVRVRGDEKVRAETLEALTHARGHIQEKISKNLPLRFTPVLTFKLDEKAQKEADVERTLRETEKGEIGIEEIDRELGE